MSWNCNEGTCARGKGAGGGARNDFWCQMMANVIGAKVIRTAGNEHGARGAFLFALTVAGQIETLQQVYNAMNARSAFRALRWRRIPFIQIVRYDLWLSLRETASRQMVAA